MKYESPLVFRFRRQRLTELSNIIVINCFFKSLLVKTNAIESLNSVVLKATRNRKVFPDDDLAKKVVYLAIQDASKRWTMPIRNWKPALNRFSIEFGERITDHL